MPPVELPDAKGVGPAFAAEPPPPLGERNRKLIEDGCIVQAREERLLDTWCRKLRDELLLINHRCWHRYRAVWIRTELLFC